VTASAPDVERRPASSCSATIRRGNDALAAAVTPMRPPSRLVRWLIIGVAVVFAGMAALSVAIMAFVFSIGTAMVTLDVTATAREQGTGRPVSGCRLAFERNQTSGWGQTTERTDADGRSRHEVSYSYVGSPLMPWDRDRAPTLTFFIGAPPRYDSEDEVEKWIVHLGFDEPWSGTEVRPETRVERVMAFEDAMIDGKVRRAGFRPLSMDDQSLAPIVVTLGRDASGRPLYRVPIEISLDAAQIAACTR
jgi:hypothetical protein